MSEPPTIDSAVALEAWLKGRSPWLAAILANRIALRVAPLGLADAIRLGPAVANRQTLSVLRALALGRCEGDLMVRPRAINASILAADAADDAAAITTDYTTRADAAYYVAGAAARASYAATITDANNAATTAEHLAYYTVHPNHAAGTAAFTGGDAYAGDAAFWTALNQDIVFAHESDTEKAHTLLALPLWPDQPPREFTLAWQATRSDPDAQQLWSEWHRWYDRRLKGRKSEWGLNARGEREMARRLIEADEAFWQAGEEDPATVNAQLAAWRRDLTPERKPKPTPDNAPGKIDFFISYTSPDDAMAREVVAVLEGAGFTTFAMFKDIPAGEFTRELNRGLGASHAMFALYSQAYMASPHCMAELEYAYVRAKRGEARYLRPLELQHCERPPLAETTVYQSLVGQPPDARRELILKLARAGEQKLDRDELLERARKLASPDVSVGPLGKLEMAQNPASDTPETPGALADALRKLKLLLPGVVAGFQPNHPALIKVNLGIYCDTLRSEGERAAWGDLDRVMVHAESEFRGAEPTMFGDGLRDQIGECFAVHHKLMASLREAPERHNVLAELRVDEDAPSDAIREVVDAAQAAFEGLAADGVTAPSFDAGAQKLVQQGRDIQYAPPSAPAPEPALPELTEERIATATLDDIQLAPQSPRKGVLIGTWSVLRTTLDVVSKLPGTVSAVGLIEHAIQLLLRLIY